MRSKVNIETNENDNMTYLNLGDATKVKIRGKFMSLQTYLKKQEKSQVNNLKLHLKQLEKRKTKAVQSKH